MFYEHMIDEKLLVDWFSIAIAKTQYIIYKLSFIFEKTVQITNIITLPIGKLEFIFVLIPHKHLLRLNIFYNKRFYFYQ